MNRLLSPYSLLLACGLPLTLLAGSAWWSYFQATDSAAPAADTATVPAILKNEAKSAKTRGRAAGEDADSAKSFATDLWAGKSLFAAATNNGPLREVRDQYEVVAQTRQLGQDLARVREMETFDEKAKTLEQINNRFAPFLREAGEYAGEVRVTVGKYLTYLKEKAKDEEQRTAIGAKIRETLDTAEKALPDDTKSCLQQLQQLDQLLLSKDSPGLSAEQAGKRDALLHRADFQRQYGELQPFGSPKRPIERDELRRFRNAFARADLAKYWTPLERTKLEGIERRLHDVTLLIDYVERIDGADSVRALVDRLRNLGREAPSNMVLDEAAKQTREWLQRRLFRAEPPPEWKANSSIQEALSVKGGSGQVELKVGVYKLKAVTGEVSYDFWTDPDRRGPNDAESIYINGPKTYDNLKSEPKTWRALEWIGNYNESRKGVVENFGSRGAWLDFEARCKDLVSKSETYTDEFKPQFYKVNPLTPRFREVAQLCNDVLAAENWKDLEPVLARR